MRVPNSLAFVLTAVIAGLAAGCGGSADTPSTQPSESLPSELRDTKPLTAIYEVDGPGKADMTYDTGSGPSADDNDAKLPWRKEVTVRDRRSAGLLSVVAMSFDAKSPLTCRIVLDGEVIDEQTDFPGVSCHA